MSKYKAPNCAEGCSKAEYLLINGEEETYLCEPSMENSLLDLVKSNNRLVIYSRKRKDGITVIELA